jgi:hypothetical protein
MNSSSDIYPEQHLRQLVLEWIWVLSMDQKVPVLTHLLPLKVLQLVLKSLQRDSLTVHQDTAMSPALLKNGGSPASSLLEQKENSFERASFTVPNLAAYIPTYLQHRAR